jgi:hypothetical protein
MFIKHFSTEPATSSLKDSATRENESLPLGYDWLIKKIVYHATIAQQTKRVKEQNTNQRASRMYKSVKIGIRWSKDETFQSLLKTLVSVVLPSLLLLGILSHFLRTRSTTGLINADSSRRVSLSAGKNIYTLETTL